MPTIELKLRLAKREDFIKVTRINPDGTKKFGIIEGIPFWLYNSKGEIENRHYITRNDKDFLMDMATWITREQILIPEESYE